MEAVRALLDRIAELEAALDALREAALAVLRAFGENDASNAVGLAVGEQVDMLRAALGEGE